MNHAKITYAAGQEVEFPFTECIFYLHCFLDSDRHIQTHWTYKNTEIFFPLRNLFLVTMRPHVHYEVVRGVGQLLLLGAHRRAFIKTGGWVNLDMRSWGGHCRQGNAWA